MHFCGIGLHSHERNIKLMLLKILGSHYIFFLNVLYTVTLILSMRSFNVADNIQKQKLTFHVVTSTPLSSNENNAEN